MLQKTKYATAHTKGKHFFILSTIFFSHWMGYISYNLFHQIRVYTSNAKGFAILHPQRNQISQSKKIKEKNVISTTSYNPNLDWLSFIPF